MYKSLKPISGISTPISYYLLVMTASAWINLWGCPGRLYTCLKM